MMMDDMKMIIMKIKWDNDDNNNHNNSNEDDDNEWKQGRMKWS
jgi:hypothetical protein